MTERRCVSSGVSLSRRACMLSARGKAALRDAAGRAKQGEEQRTCFLVQPRAVHGDLYRLRRRSCRRRGRHIAACSAAAAACAETGGAAAVCREHSAAEALGLCKRRALRASGQQLHGSASAAAHGGKLPQRAARYRRSMWRPARPLICNADGRRRAVEKRAASAAQAVLLRPLGQGASAALEPARRRSLYLAPSWKRSLSRHTRTGAGRGHSGR